MYISDNGVVNGTTRTCELKFLRSPVEILSSPATNSVQGIKLEFNQLEVMSWKFQFTIAT